MSSAYYYITLIEGDKAYELESYSIYELAERYALEMNLRTGAKPKVYYHSTLDNSDFEVWPLDGLAGRYLR